MKAFTIMGRVLKATWDDLFLCVFLSLAWWAGTLLVLTAAPAMVGMNQVANRIANYRRADMSFFWEGARSHIARGWLLYLIFLFVPLLLLFNIWFYFQADGLLQMMAIVLAWFLLLSLLVGQYVFPLFWQQDEPNLRLVLRNATLLALRNPLYSLLMVLFDLLLIGLSVLLTLPLVLLLPGMLAFSGNFALTGLLQGLGLAPEPPEIPKRAG